jgi:hypothetical protein
MQPWRILPGGRFRSYSPTARVKAPVTFTGRLQNSIVPVAGRIIAVLIGDCFATAFGA